MNTVIGKYSNQLTDIPSELLQIEGGRRMHRSLDARSLATLFYNARTHYSWTPEAIEPSLLKEIYDFMKWAPTAANASPLRVTFIESPEAKERLLPAVNAGNIEKVRTAPVTAILSYDTRFFEKLDLLAPHMPKPSRFETDHAAATHIAEHNAWLQAGYFMMAVRSVGLDCGPIGGFDQAKVNAEFFGDGRNRSFLIVNIGYGKREALRPRAARLDFEDACAII